MPTHRAITRSRSKKLRGKDGNTNDFNDTYVPPPLNIRKANAMANPPKQRFDGGAIGLAVGSPKDSPLPPLPNDKSNPNQFDFQFEPPLEHDAPTSNGCRDAPARDIRPKGNMWKAFGGLFSKTHTNARNAERPNHSAVQTVRAEDRDMLSHGTASGRKRAGSDKEKAMEHRDPSAHVPVARKPSLMRRASSKRKAAKRRIPTEGVRPDEVRPTRTSNTYGKGDDSLQKEFHRMSRHVHMAKALGDYSLLQVEIPNVQLERYSIMFGSVLQATPNASKTSLVKPNTKRMESPKPSEKILAAPPSLEELPKPHRREGSGSSTRSKSPSFSLFPPTQAVSGRGLSPARSITNKALPKPSPLSRSVTAPQTNVSVPPRPPMKPTKSDDPAPVLVSAPVLPLAPGKENIPVSRWSRNHSRQGSQNTMHSRHSSLEAPVRSGVGYGHVAQQSLDNVHRPSTSHNRKSSTDRPAAQPSTHHRGVLLNGFDPLSANPTTFTSSSRPSTGQQGEQTSHSKHAFMNRAFPTRKSSLKRMNTAGKAAAQQDPGKQEISPLTPPQITATPERHASSESVGSAAEVSIARQISISRRQRQLLVPVVAKTATQPVHPLVVDGLEGGARKSELVMFEDADASSVKG